MHLPFAARLQLWFICDPLWTFPLIHATRWQFHGSPTGSTSQLSVCALLSFCARVQPYLPTLILAYAPISCFGTCLWSTKGGRASLEGHAKGKKVVLEVRTFWGLALLRPTSRTGGGLALTRRTGGGGGLSANEAHGGGVKSRVP